MMAPGRTATPVGFSRVASSSKQIPGHTTSTASTASMEGGVDGTWVGTGVTVGDVVAPLMEGELEVADGGPVQIQPPFCAACALEVHSSG
jgi:hypothetical protein